MSSYDSEIDDDIDLSEEIEDARSLRESDRTNYGKPLPRNDGEEPEEEEEELDFDDDDEFDEDNVIDDYEEDEDLEEDEDEEDEDEEDEDEEEDEDFEEDEDEDSQSLSESTPSRLARSARSQSSTRASQSSTRASQSSTRASQSIRASRAQAVPKSQVTKRRTITKSGRRNAVVLRLPPAATLDNLLRIEEGESTEMFQLRQRLTSSLATNSQLGLNIIAAIQMGAILMSKIRYGTTYPEEVENLINDVLKKMK